jgi:hypothetical protein
MAALTREQAHAQLDKLRDGLADQHADADPARLQQLDSHARTIHMVVDQLYDDADKRGA